jgi:hypothetical protein
MNNICYEIKRTDKGTYTWIVDGVTMGEAMTLREAVVLLDAFQQKENGNV